MVNVPKNICPKCGGPLMLRRYGSYGEDYRITKAGQISRNRTRRILFETDGNTDCMVFCENCGESREFTIDISGRIRIEG